MDMPIRGHTIRRQDNLWIRQFTDVAICWQDISLTWQFMDCGRFMERHFMDKQDYLRTNCLQSTLYMLRIHDELEPIVR